MATNSTIEQTVFQYAVDQQSINTVKNAASNLETALNAGKQELAAYGTVSQSSMRSVEAAVDAGTRALYENQDAVEAIRNEWLKTEQAADAAADAEKRASSGVKSGGITGGIDRVGSVGSQILSGLGAGEAANAAGLLGDVAGAIGALPPVAIAGTAAMSAFAIVIGHATAETNQVTEATKKYLDAQANAERFIAGATTQSIEERRDALAKQLNIENAIYASRDSAFQELRSSLNTIDLARAEAGLAFGEYRALLRAREEQGATVLTLAQDMLTLNEALRDGSGAANDAAEQIKTEASQIEADFTERQRIAKLTRDQRDQEIDANLKQIQALADLYLSESDNAEVVKYVDDAVTELTHKNELLAEATTFASDAEAELKAAREGAIAQGKSALDSITAEVQAREKLTTANKAFTDAEKADAQKIADLNEGVKQKEIELETKTNLAIGALETKAQQQREKDKEAHEKKLQQIENQFAADHFNAVANRDYLAAKTAAEKRKTDLDTENDSYKDRQTQLESALKDQEGALRESQRQQLADAQKAANDAIALEQKRWADEKVTKQQAVDQARVALQNALASEEIIRGNALNREGVMIAQHWAGVYANTDFWLTAIEHRAATLNVPTPTADYVPTSRPFYPPASFGASSTGQGGQPVIINNHVNGVLTGSEVYNLVDNRIEHTLDLAA